MGIEELEGQKRVQQKIERIEEDIQKIRDNELYHIEGRLSHVEQAVKPPLSTFLLGGILAIFIAVVGFVLLPASVGWPLLIVCAGIVVASLIGIKKSVKGKNDY